MSDMRERARRWLDEQLLIEGATTRSREFWDDPKDSNLQRYLADFAEAETAAYRELLRECQAWFSLEMRGCHQPQIVPKLHAEIVKLIGELRMFKNGDRIRMKYLEDPCCGTIIDAGERESQVTWDDPQIPSSSELNGDMELLNPTTAKATEDGQ